MEVDVLLSEVVTTSSRLAATPARRTKVAALADCLRGLGGEEIPIATGFLSGRMRQGTVGVGYASLRGLPAPAAAPSLTLSEVDATLERVATVAGRGSQSERAGLLGDLFGRATAEEQQFLAGLLTGELRQGALEGVMVEAVAAAAGIDSAAVRRGLMLRGDLGEVARAALTGGRDGLASFRMALLRPIQPMLAKTAEDLDAAFARVHPAAVEWKLDGARIQVHRRERDVRVFTRTLRDVSSEVPEIVEAVLALPTGAVVLDGEAIALREDGRPQPFQVTMSRFGSSLEVPRLRQALPLSAFFFDCLHLDGDDLIDRPLHERASALAEVVPPALRVPRTLPEHAAAARDFYATALRRGHEGVMVKGLDAAYEAGRRGWSWLKVKHVHVLDLVVLAAEWGHGRRKGWLSNLHLGARDPATGGFVMLGKTFKGMTDEILAWQTERLQQLAVSRTGSTVRVRPELVVEVAFEGLQESPRYPGGLALRFARIKGYRPDKRAADADTIDTVRALAADRPS